MENTTPPNQQRDLHDKISLLVDGELDHHTERDLLKKIETCNETMRLYKNQVAYKKNVSEKVTRMSCGEDLKEALRSKIRGL